MGASWEANCKRSCMVVSGGAGNALVVGGRLPAKLSFIPVLPAFLIADATRTALIAFGALTLLGLAVRLLPAWGRVAEWAVLALLVADGWRAHRYGDLTRPHAFADFLVLRGYDVGSGYNVLAFGLFTLLFLHVVGENCVERDEDTQRGQVDHEASAQRRAPNQNRTHIRPWSWLALAGVGVFAFWAVFAWMPMSAISPRPPAKPPISFSAEPPPPSPPDPEVVAVVELGDPLYVPWKLGGYYFRTGSLDTPTATVPTPVQSPVSPVGSTALRPPTPIPNALPPAIHRTGAITAVPGSAQRSATPDSYRLTLYLRAHPKQPWAVPGQIDGRLEAASKAGYAEQEELTFRHIPEVRFVPVDSDLENPASLSLLVFGEQTWDNATKGAYLRTSDDPLLPALLERILAELHLKGVVGTVKPDSDLARLREAMELAERDADGFPAARVVAIREWLESSIIYDDRVPAPKNAAAVQEFLHGDLKGGDASLAQAAVLLLRAAAIPSRTAVGYLVPLEKQHPDRFVVFDQHATEWVEIYVQSLGWVPLVISPRQQVSHQTPPPAKAKQDQTIRQLDEPQSTANAGILARILRLILGVLAAMALMVAGILVSRRLWRYYRRFVSLRYKPMREDQQLHRYLLGRSADLLEFAGLRRDFGETWENFAGRLSHEPGMRSCAEAFDSLVRLNARAESVPVDESGMKDLQVSYIRVRRELPIRRFFHVLWKLR